MSLKGNNFSCGIPHEGTYRTRNLEVGFNNITINSCYNRNKLELQYAFIWGLYNLGKHCQ